MNRAIICPRCKRQIGVAVCHGDTAMALSQHSCEEEPHKRVTIRGVSVPNPLEIVLPEPDPTGEGIPCGTYVLSE